MLKIGLLIFLNYYTLSAETISGIGQKPEEFQQTEIQSKEPLFLINPRITPEENAKAETARLFKRNGLTPTVQQEQIAYDGFLKFNILFRKKTQQYEMAVSPSDAVFFNNFKNKVIKTWDLNLKERQPIKEADTLFSFSTPTGIHQTEASGIFLYEYKCGNNTCITNDYENDVIRRFSNSWKDFSKKHIDYYKAFWKFCYRAPKPENCVKENKQSIEAAFQNYRRQQTVYLDEATKIFSSAIPNKMDVPEELVNDLLSSDKEIIKEYRNFYKLSE